MWDVEIFLQLQEQLRKINATSPAKQFFWGIGKKELAPLKEIQEKIKSKIASNEFGDPENILSTIKYIRATAYLNGACLELNGGLV